MSAPGLYVHIPFCPQICPYCAFAKVLDRPDQHQRYIDAVCRELEASCWRPQLGTGAFATVFVGGGTPSLIDPPLLAQVLDAAQHGRGLAAGAEITVEANPGSADAERFAALRRAGFIRLSIGVQAFDDVSLRSLGRVHDVAAAAAALNAARLAGFDNVSLDLISGVPGSGAGAWRATIERAIGLQPEHISAYALTVEEGTWFAARQAAGQLKTASEAEEAETQVWTSRRLREAGYEHYEVSNFALPGRRSRHNWGYWSGVPYLGVGVSAHSYDGCTRSWNHPDLHHYFEAVEAGDSPRAGSEFLDRETRLCERIWLGLRTCEGVKLADRDLETLLTSERLNQLCGSGYLSLDGARLCVTDSGRPLADALGIEVTTILEGVRSKPATALAVT